MKNDGNMQEQQPGDMSKREKQEDLSGRETWHRASQGLNGPKVIF